MNSSVESADMDTTKISQITTSKPTSLLTLFPEKEPIIFDANLSGAPPEIEHLLQHIKVIAEQFLYRWKTFPISIPKPISAVTTATTMQQQDSRKFRPLNLRELFHNPPFDELDSVALDASGEPKRLSKNQLKELREKGAFCVPSLNFPGQEHRWKLSQFLQKGYLCTRECLLNDMALAAELIFITAKNRVVGDFFSISESTRALAYGAVLLIDMIVGVPSLVANDLDHKIREERSRFLVAELSICGDDEDCMDTLSNFVRKQLRRAATEKFNVEYEIMEFRIPYLFRTPKGLEIDLRLFSKDIMRKALPIVVNILERVKCLRVRERLIDNKLIDTNIDENINDEYLQRVFTSVLDNPDLAKLGDKIPQLLVKQAKSVVIMHAAMERVQKDIDEKKSEQQRYLMNAYPILSKVRPWLKEKLEKVEISKISECRWTAPEEAIKMAKKHNLHQTAYFLHRDLVFMREREPVLLKELRNVKTPTRSFRWPCRIWSPKSWIVRRIFQGTSEIIQTVTCSTVTSIVTPRSDPSQPVFLVEKEIIRTNSTRWPFWRILNLIQRIWCYVWNVIYLFGYIVPWESPVGLRALFFVKPFMPQLELSQVNGTLFPRKTSITQTLASRLIELWRHISKERTQFESEPDTGFISKGVTRAINQIWNYFFKGFIGTVSIVFLFPLLCVVVSFGSILLAITAPFWIPPSVLLYHLFMIFVYDLDCPKESRYRYSIFLQAIVWNIFIQGILQPIFALFVGGILCPIIALAIIICSTVRMSVRQMWDYLIFEFFIKKYARVPSNDSFAVKRISGPGLAMDYSLSIKPEQALAALEARMELDELEAFEARMELEIYQPQRDFNQFVDACFGPFSAQLNAKSIPYKNLKRESRELLSLLKEKLEKRRRELQIGLTANVRNRIRLYATDLNISIQHGAHLLEKFYPQHVIDRLPMTQEAFWHSKELQSGDWAGLAGQIYTQIFSHEFLRPLNDLESIFKLESNMNLDLTRYIEMVQSASDTTGINGPDLLENLFAPKGNTISSIPYLDASAFNPRSKVFASFKKNDNDNIAGSINQTKYKSYLRLNTLPIPHPVYTAIGIYNRDCDDPIPLDDNICLNILKALEECNDDAVNVMTWYKNGGSRSGMTTREPSIESLEDGDNEENEDKFSTHASHSSAYNTCAIASTNNCETLPCGAVTSHKPSDVSKKTATKSFQWTLNNWRSSTQTRPNNSTAIRVDLASPEDISLDTDNSSRVGFGTYGTTV